MSLLRMIYLILTFVGAMVPLWYIFLWSRADDASVSGLLAAWQINAATSALAWNLIIAATALIIWIIAETRVRRNWSALWAIPATLLVGVSFGLPLYLFLRTRPI